MNRIASRKLLFWFSKWTCSKLENDGIRYLMQRTSKVNWEILSKFHMH